MVVVREGQSAIEKSLHLYGISPGYPASLTFLSPHTTLHSHM